MLETATGIRIIMLTEGTQNTTKTQEVAKVDSHYRWHDATPDLAQTRCKAPIDLPQVNLLTTYVARLIASMKQREILCGCPCVICVY